MTKSRVWPVRAIYMLLAAALVISLIITTGPAFRADAAPGNDVKAEWERVGTPTVDGWVLAPESAIIDYAVADEGEVAYAIVVQDYDPCEEEMDWGPYFLLKSTNHAATWSDITSGVKKEIGNNASFDLLLVATDGVDPDFVAVAAGIPGASFHVFVSNDGGSTFKKTATAVGLDDVYVLRVSPEVAGKREIAIGGSGPECHIWRITVTNGTPGAPVKADYNDWEPCAAVVDIQFSPNWATDWTVLAVTVTGWGSGEDVHLQSGSWGAAGWNTKSTLGIAPVLVKEDVWLPSRLGRGIAGIALPSDYNSKTTATRVLWVWVNYYDDDAERARSEIRRVSNTDAGTAGPLSEIDGGNAWLTNISYHGTIASGKAIAGLLGSGRIDGRELKLAACCEGVQVFRNDGIANMIICCEPWTSSCKPPTGRVAMAVEYVTPNKAYAIALNDPTTWHTPWAYDEGAWSFSLDDGDTWNQLSLIDTYIDYLSDVAVSPDCNKTMLVSVNLDMGCECDSVWLHAVNLPEAPEYSGQWIRTWCGRLVGENDDFAYGEVERGLLRLNPEETTGDTVYLVDRMSGNVYRNELEGLACWDRIASTEVTKIVDLAVKDADTVYALNQDGKVSMFDGDSWQKAVDSKVKKGWTIAVHGDDILVGGRDGEVAHSSDAGATFTKLAKNVPSKGALNLVTVAFDSYFDQNDTIFAAVYAWTDDVGTDYAGGIYLWVVGESTSWTNTGADSKKAYTGLVLDNADGNPKTSPATGGVLYASFVGEYEKKWEGNTYWTGVARSLTPIVDILCLECTEWDYLVVGLTPGGYEGFEAMPQALKICGCLDATTNSKLFSIDWWDCYDICKGQEGTVWTFEDCYAKKGVTLRQPADGFVVPADPCECKNAPFTTHWDRLCDACFYEIQIATDAAFDNILIFIDGEDDRGVSPIPAANPSWLIKAEAALSPGVTYYWRIRAVEAGTLQRIRSWWSDARTFTVAPFAGTGVQIVAPAMGATNVARTNIAFVWESIAPADEFDFELSRESDFDPTVDSAQGLTTTGYTYTGAALAYDTPYYWRVTALQDGTPVSQAMGTFRTIPQPPPPPEEPPPPVTPAWVWVVIAIGAVLVIVVIVLIFRTRRV